MANETIEILKVLIGNKEETYSIRKIALLRKINYKSAYNAVKILEKEGVIDLKKIGNTVICSFNDKFNDLVFKAEYLRREDMFRRKDFLVMHSYLTELKTPFVALLFGSQAKGTADKNSDIDLLIISSDEEARAINDKLNLLPHKIHLTHVTFEGFIRMAKSKEFTVVSEAIKKNIILVGIEDYYGLLKNVRER